MAKKILFAPKYSDEIMQIARSLMPPGFELAPADFGTPEFIEAAQTAEYFLGTARGAMAGEFFRSAPNLKLVQLTSAGYDRVDLESARKAKVPVSNNGGANSLAVAEHTIMLMLAVLKRLVFHHNNVVAGKWRVGDMGHNIFEAGGRTLGIIGLGNIGKKVARRARVFEMNVQYYDILRLTEDQEDALGVKFVLLDELLRTSDVVTLHVPLTDRTRKIIGARELSMMKPSAILINTCRGPVIDEDALYKALSTRQIAAAGLDVMVEEPPAPKHQLFTLPNVTLTPHSAGPTWENWVSRFRNAFDNIQRVENGGKPRWTVYEMNPNE